LAGLTGTPVIILKEGSKRETGKDAQKKNIMAARAVADSVKSTLGPKGMDKMLIDGTGDATITNDGATILREMDIEHPVAKMIVEVAKAQDDEIGDGTTTAVVIAGELLKRAEDLIDAGVHPTVIVAGYKQAQAKAEEVLENLAVDVSKDDRDILLKIAQTAMTGKGIELFMKKLSEISIDAAIAVSESGKIDVEDTVKVVKIPGGRLEDSTINYGVVVEKERLDPGMPKKVENARIVLLEGTLELKKLGTDAKITISKADELQSFKQGEELVLQKQVEALVAVDANVVFCQKGIGLTASRFLSKHGILAARRVKDEDLKMLSLATGGKVIADPMQITEQDLGHCRLVEERKVGDDHMIFVEDCAKAKAVSIILHGVSEQFLDEIERAMNDALHVVLDVLKSGKIVPGGGAPEIEVSERVRQYASSLSGRDQLAVMAYANAVESIPSTLAENAGFDPVDVLVAVRSKHGQGMKNFGVDISTGEPSDMLAKGVVEPLKVKTQAIKSATEAATMVLRVDDVIAAKRGELTPKPGQSPHDYTRRPF